MGIGDLEEVLGEAGCLSEGLLGNHALGLPLSL